MCRDGRYGHRSDTLFGDEGGDHRIDGTLPQFMFAEEIHFQLFVLSAERCPFGKCQDDGDDGAEESVISDPGMPVEDVNIGALINC